MLALSLAVAGVMLEYYRGVRLELARLEAQSGLAGPERRPLRAQKSLNASLLELIGQRLMAYGNHPLKPTVLSSIWPV